VADVRVGRHKGAGQALRRKIHAAVDEHFQVHDARSSANKNESAGEEGSRSTGKNKAKIGGACEAAWCLAQNSKWSMALAFEWPGAFIHLIFPSQVICVLRGAFIFCNPHSLSESLSCDSPGATPERHQKTGVWP
jgi:hypothetical protein